MLSMGFCQESVSLYRGLTTAILSDIKNGRNIDPLVGDSDNMKVPGRVGILTNKSLLQQNSLGQPGRAQDSH